MKYAASFVMLFVLALAGSAMAQCPTACPPAQVTTVTPCPAPAQVVCPEPCPAPVQVTCPPPCPAPAQVVCPQPCPEPVTVVCPAPCPAAIPAAVGAGPSADLTNLQCPDFDPAFARDMYSQNGVIIAVTEYGRQRATNANLRDISGEIRGTLLSANRKLEQTFGLSAGCIDMARAQSIIAELSTQCGDCFNAVYARTLSALLNQSNATNQLAATRSGVPELKNHAAYMADKEANWAFRLDRWVTENGFAT